MVVAGHDGSRDHALRAMRVATDMLSHACGSTFCGERLQVCLHASVSFCLTQPAIERTQPTAWHSDMWPSGRHSKQQGPFDLPPPSLHTPSHRSVWACTRAPCTAAWWAPRLRASLSLGTPLLQP